MSCYTGFSLDVGIGACLIDATKALYTYAWQTDSQLTNITASSTSYIFCGSTLKTIFGYEDQDYNALTNTNTLNKYMGYSFVLSGLNYYAIRVKIGVLFID